MYKSSKHGHNMDKTWAGNMGITYQSHMGIVSPANCEWCYQKIDSQNMGNTFSKLCWTINFLW